VLVVIGGSPGGYFLVSSSTGSCAGTKGSGFVVSQAIRHGTLNTLAKDRFTFRCERPSVRPRRVASFCFLFLQRTAFETNEHRNTQRSCTANIPPSLLPFRSPEVLHACTQKTQEGEKKPRLNSDTPCLPLPPPHLPTPPAPPALRKY